ncbi:MAG: hypothetical protein ACO4AZ_01565 [Ilumatobacteraceae bacterium]
MGKKRHSTTVQLDRVKSVVLDGVEVTSGDKFVVEDEEGVYKFKWLEADGSLTCWGGTSQRESYRTFAFDRCHPVGWARPVSDDDASTASVTRAGRYELFEAWASKHAEEQFTTVELAEIAGFSNQTMLKYLESSFLFTKVKRGLWRVNDIAPRGDMK